MRHHLFIIALAFMLVSPLGRIYFIDEPTRGSWVDVLINYENDNRFDEEDVRIAATSLGDIADRFVTREFTMEDRQKDAMFLSLWIPHDAPSYDVIKFTISNDDFSDHIYYPITIT